MKHEIFDEHLEVADTDISFESIYKKSYVPADYIDDIKKANLLIVPTENFRDEGDFLFPETTRDFFDFVKDCSVPQVIPDIAVGDENFQCIELHCATINVATIIVQLVVLPFAINIVSSFVFDLVKKYRRKPEDTTAKVKIIAEETKTKKSKAIMYEGPVSGIKDALEQAAKHLFSEES